MQNLAEVQICAVAADPAKPDLPPEAACSLLLLVSMKDICTLH